MITFVLLHKIFRKNASEPRLISLEDSDVQDRDISFEEAVVDSRLSHFLHSEYDGVQPSADAYSKLLVVIESGEKKQVNAREVGSEQAASIGYRLSRAVSNLGLKPNRARLVSGAVTLVVMAAVVSPYLSTIADRSAGLPSLDSETSYNFQALRASDPPEMWGPHPQTRLYLDIREPDPIKGELRKE